MQALRQDLQAEKGSQLPPAAEASQGMGRDADAGGDRPQRQAIPVHRVHSLVLCVFVVVFHVRDLYFFELTAEGFSLKVPQMCHIVGACRCQQSIFGIKLCKVDLSVLTSLP